MKNSEEVKKEMLKNKDYPVQKVALKDGHVTDEVVEESVEEINPEEETRERG